MTSFPDNILNPREAVNIAMLKKSAGKKIVLAGGCFDILHPGHISFLKSAREQGDILFLLLESDENVRRLKGKDRPINSRERRARTLSELGIADYIIKFVKLPTDKDYDRLIAQIRPDIIAVTEGDPDLKKRESQAKIVGGEVRSVTRRTKHSTTNEIAQLR